MRGDATHALKLGGVSLFAFEPDDVADSYVAWLNDPEINRYLESRLTRHTLESTRGFVAAVLESADSVMFGIRDSLDSHVGNIKIGPINRAHGTAEIGILIGDRSVWGRGVATAAISLVCDYARERLSLRKVTAGCYASNAGSKRAFEKAGFVVECVRPQQVLLDGRPEDLVLMGRVLAG